MARIMRFPRLRDEGDKKKGRAIEKLVKRLSKKYSKKETKDISVLSESIFSGPQVFVSSGILPIDCVVCYGLGWPVGIIEIFGEEASAKSAILEMTLATAQAHDYHTVLFPMEYSIDIHRAIRVGINPKRLIIGDAETIEDVYEEIKDIVKVIREKDQETPIVMGWDTITATPTRSEMEDKKDKGLEASDMGKMALQMSKLFRRLVRFLRVNNVCLICINQTRTNLGKMWGDKETTSGGKALRFYAWVRCRTRVIKTLKDKDGKETGIMCLFHVRKNKVDSPHRECKLPIYWGRGIDQMGANWEYAIDTEVLKLDGTVYKYKGEIVTKKSFPKFYLNHKKRLDRAMRRAEIVKHDRKKD